MSIEKYHIISIGVFWLLTLAMALQVAVADGTTGSDPVLQFYCRRAAAVHAARDPVAHGAHYSFLARTYYKRVSKKGEIERIDSVVARYYFSYGNLDSQKIIVAPSRKVKEVDFDVPNVFTQSRVFNFFPNDTGGHDLAISFDSYSMDSSSVVGIAIIDREKYFLRRLYLYYPNKPDYRRYSRLLRLVEHEGYVFPDSIWEVCSKGGVFFTDNYRLETGIEDIKIYR